MFVPILLAVLLLGAAFCLYMAHRTNHPKPPPLPEAEQLLLEMLQLIEGEPENWERIRSDFSYARLWNCKWMHDPSGVAISESMLIPSPENCSVYFSGPISDQLGKMVAEITAYQAEQTKLATLAAMTSAIDKL